MDEQQDRKAQQNPRKLGPRGKGGGMTPKENKKKDFIVVIDDKYITDPKRFFEDQGVVIMNSEKKAKGGRAGYKSGMRVCKLAKRGKGKAYGKNS